MMKLRLLTSLFFVTIFSFSIFSVVAPKNSEAVTARDWKPGRIIDDAVFFNKDAMSPAQIQQFLNSKVPVCNTNYNRSFWLYGHWNSPPWTCIKDYKENGKSAAQIIWEAGQRHGINPQVLIITLQKETAIITDTWAAPWQYKRATGYLCPDSKLGTDVDANQNGCYDSHESFTAQINGAAWQLKRYTQFPDSYNFKAGVTRNILWSPNASCGSSPVYIETQGTAALYNYTPYQPNAAALNNMYGTGDNCSSYGNRNFWRMFNDWFGSTTGKLWRTANDGTLYLIHDGSKYLIKDINLIRQYGLTGNDIRFVSQEELNSVPNASSPNSFALGQLVKSNSEVDEDGSTVYFIDNGRRIPLNSMNIFNEFGFSEKEITYLPISLIRQLPQSDPLLNYIQDDSLSLYKISGGKKHIIFELNRFNQLNPSGAFTRLSSQSLQKISFGQPEIEGVFMTLGPDSTIRLYNKENYYTLTSMNQYECLGLTGLRYLKINSYELLGVSYSAGNVNCIAKNSTNEVYLFDKNKKYPIEVTENYAAVQLPDEIFNRISTGQKINVISSPVGEISVINNGIRQPIPNMATFWLLGYRIQDVQKISQPAYSSITTGQLKFATGSLILDNDGTIYVIIDSKRYTITSPAIFNDYRFSWNELIKINDKATLEAYPLAGVLGKYIKSQDDKVLIVDNGNVYHVAENLYDDFAINPLTIKEYNDNILYKTIKADITRFLKSSDSNTIYYIENGKKRPITSWNTLVSLNGQSSIVTVSNSLLSRIPYGLRI